MSKKSSTLCSASEEQHEGPPGSSTFANVQPLSTFNTSTSQNDSIELSIPSFSSFPDIEGAVPLFSSFPDLTETNLNRGEPLERNKAHKTTNRENQQFRSSSSSEYTSDRNEDPSRSKKNRSKLRQISEVLSSSEDSASSDSYSRSGKFKRKQRHDVHRHKSSTKRNRLRDRSKESEIRRDKHSRYQRDIGLRIASDSRLFTIDRQGDDNILQFGLYKYGVPSYRRVGDGRVLGLSEDMRIDLEASKGTDGLVIRPIWRKKTIRYTDRRFGLKDERDIKRIRFNFDKNQSSTLDWHQTYIPFENDDNPQDKERDIDIPDYRDIERKEFGEKQIKPTQEEGLTYEEYLRQKNKDFSVQLDKEPHNIKLWLQFIDFQDESGLFGKKVSSSSTRTSINEIKISIFEKALSKNSNNEKLLLGYLKCCEQIWDVPKLLTKWDQVLKENSRTVSLWIEYLNFRQTNLASFSFTQCIEVFEECLGVLRREAEISKDLEERTSTENILVHIFLRFCIFLAQSGYIERAYACLQSIMEVTFFTSESLQSLSFDERLLIFEKFWESEDPRFGEKGAKGWSYYETRCEEDDECEKTEWASNEQLPQADENADSYQNWLAAETSLEKAYQLPLRSDAQADLKIDDPYRIVLFDDIKKYLFDLTSSEARINMIYACFNFLRLPFNPCRSSNHSFVADSFLHSEMANESLANANFWPSTHKSDIPSGLVNDIYGVIMDREIRSEEKKIWKFPLKAFPQDHDNLFPSKHWFCICEESTLVDVNLAFARNAFNQICKVFSNTDLNLCSLALESSVDTKNGGRKYAKEMLKTERLNLALWNGYAQLEKSRNNFAEARRVYITALSMYRSFPEQHQVDAPLLYKMFAEMEIEQGRPNTALNILVMLTEEKGSMDSISNQDMMAPSPTRLLKARKFYEQRIADLSNLAASQDASRNVIHICVCFALLEHLSQNLNEACKIFELILAELMIRNASDTIECELIYFLSLYFYNEARTKIQNRVRRFYDNALTKKPTHVLWTFSIFVELYQHKPFNQHIVRSLFERALECSTSRNSIALWILYLNFEIKYNRLDRAKALYFRAIRECPWSKEIYLFAFRVLRSIFTTDELDEVMNLMLEKEIRLRVSFERYVDENDKTYELMDVDSSQFEVSAE
ncbi:hypothetical protein G9A89_022042 [Geosiphon pyriformis]|nr:hypothetical protein G9A89_022042 [Geosiphon pyriformis]